MVEFINNVSATDNCDTPMLVCAPASGSLFSVGTHLITCTATDLTGNTNACTFNVIVTGVPEIGVQQPAGTDLAAGMSTVDFGRVALGLRVTNTFVITNTGTVELILTNPNNCVVQIVGGDPGNFFEVEPAASPIPPGGSATFTIRFTPASAGFKTATARIENNDSDENPFSSP